MSGIYKTVNGDTWDTIAKTVYGDELKADYLMQNNPRLIDIFIFGIGTEVSVPDLPETTKAQLPPWRT